MKDLKFKEEIAKMEYEPLDETELKLVRYSLGLGIALLIIFYVVSVTIFPESHQVQLKPTSSAPAPAAPAAPAVAAPEAPAAPAPAEAAPAKP